VNALPGDDDVVTEPARRLQAGSEWDRLNILDNPAFSRVRVGVPPRTSKEERVFNTALYAAMKLAQEGVAVTAETLNGENSEIPKRVYVDLLGNEKFQDALEARGIRTSTVAGLSPHQMSALAIYLDMSTKLTHAQKLKAARVTEYMWRGWMRNPEFAAHLNGLAEGILQDVKPVALQRIAEAVDDGERWAIELGLEITGRHDRRNTNVDVGAILLEVFTALDEAGIPNQVMGDIAAKIKNRIGAGVPLAPQVVQVVARPAAPQQQGELSA
jgi:hypothetical protein